MRFRTLLLVTSAVAAMVAAAGFRFLGGAEVGSAAPAFSLPSNTGKTVSLDQFKGKYVVLEWTNQGCPYVHKQYGTGNMQATQKWARDHGAIWLTIDSSAEGKQGYMTADQATALLKSAHMSSNAILLDPDGTVGHLYGAKTTPHMFVIDPKGTVIYNGAIDDKPTTDFDDVKTAKNYVEAALEEAMAGKPVTNPTSRPYGCSVKYKN
ncbi:MAG TPA: thioredoxin family protein [Fimbriimonadaceae bacterium]|nr:thioredoxin family protein [Fimbriimonadaceae bacterium]